MPKTSRDTKKDCGEPGCPNDHRSQVFARGDEVIEQSGDFRYMADFVAKVFLECRTKILRAADAFTRGDVRVHILSPKSITDLRSGVEKRSKQQRSPKINFREIFRVVRFYDFCNNIGGIADHAGLAAGSTRSRMTHLRHAHL